MRRALAGAAALVVLLLAAAPPAHAAAPVVQITTPADGQRFDVSAFAFEAFVQMPNDGTLRGNVTVSWFSPENHPVPATTSHATGNNQRSMSIFVGDRVFPVNGTYRVDVAAVGRDSVIDRNDETGRRSAQFVIDAPPAPPTGVTTGMDGERRVATSWNANGEPDIVGYEVQRSHNGTEWVQVTVTDATTTSVVDESTSQQGGSYSYRVRAFRSSAEVGKLNPSPTSSESTAQVPDPPVTTTTSTTRPSDDDGGGDEGGGTEEEEEERARQPRAGGRRGTGSSSGGAGGGTSGGGSNGSSSTTLVNKGKVDLSGFASLLEQARRTGQTPPSGRAGEDDGGYDEKLPFSNRAKKAGGDRGGDDVAIFDHGVADAGSGQVQSLAFLAGGLLATVLVMHLLWVRSEVRRTEVLETVAPGPPPSRPRRRRPPAVPVGDLPPLGPEIPHQNAK